MNKVFLGGTCNNSRWREIIKEQITMDYFDPVVKDWTEECIKEEIRQKEEECNYQLYVITPKINGYYSIAEAVHSSDIKPFNTIFCILEYDYSGATTLEFTEEQKKSLNAVYKLIKANGSYVFNSLLDVIKLLNDINGISSNNC